MSGNTFKRDKPHVNIGTIGHVDAGKTAVAEAVRRMDPDFHEPVIPKSEPRGGRTMSKLILMAAMMGGGFDLPGLGPTTRNPDPKNTDNSPDRAPGMKPFDVDGKVIYAGTRKGAMKKARLLARIETSQSPSQP